MGSKLIFIQKKITLTTIHTMRTIQDIISDTEQAICDEMEEQLRKNDTESPQFIARQIPAWRRWYLKRNQPHNYLRVTRIILPGTEENRHRWQQKFQIWVRGTLREEYRIDADTYDLYESMWGKQEMRDMTYAVYRSPAQLSAQTEAR